MICWISFFLSCLPCLSFYPVLKAGKPYISLALLNLNGSGSTASFPNGIPTRHTIGQIIRGVKAESVLECFEQWVNTIRVEGEQIAFDGKVIRGSGNGTSLNPLQLMSAMVVDSGLILYQQKVSDKTNEIPVMQSMLRQLTVKGAIITADAMHCQTHTAEIIRFKVLIIRFRLKTTSVICAKKFRRSSTRHTEIVRSYWQSDILKK
jgi:hypothetical protein